MIQGISIVIIDNFFSAVEQLFRIEPRAFNPRSIRRRSLAPLYATITNVQACSVDGTVNRVPVYNLRTLALVYTYLCVCTYVYKHV